jgi:acyl-CoA synthetase (AMP-forming)/AMP-acid ligase II
MQGGCSSQRFAESGDRGPGERVAVYLPKQPETVFSLFGAATAGACFMPINPLLKPRQLAAQLYGTSRDHRACCAAA